MRHNRVEASDPLVCPSADDLKAYLLGRQSNHDFDLIDQHLVACEKCEILLANLDSSRDSLIDRLCQAKRFAEFGADFGDGARARCRGEGAAAQRRARSRRYGKLPPECRGGRHADLRRFAFSHPAAACDGRAWRSLRGP